MHYPQPLITECTGWLESAQTACQRREQQDSHRINSGVPVSAPSTVVAGTCDLSRPKTSDPLVLLASRLHRPRLLSATRLTA